MKKLLISFFMFVFLAPTAFGQLGSVIFEKSQTAGNYPSFMTTSSTERGFAFGVAEGKSYSYTELGALTQAAGTFPSWMSTGSTERGFAYTGEKLYFVSRNSGTNVVIFNTTTSDSTGTLDMTGVSGGTFLLNDVGVSDDGIIMAANLTLDASSSAFKVYSWITEGSAPVEVISYTDATGRMGDKFTVTGSASDNSLTVYAAVSGQDTVVKFTTADNGATFTAEKIALSNGSAPNYGHVYPNTDGSEFYFTGGGVAVMRYQADGTIIDTLSTGIVSGSSAALCYFEAAGKEFIAVYTPYSGNENIRVVDVTNGLDAAELVGVTPSIGTVANGNGAGDVDFETYGDGTADVSLLGTNNGAAAYKFDFNTIPPKERIYLVSRNGGTNVIIIDAASGDSVGVLDASDVSGGTFLLNDAEVSDDNVIFAGNLTTDASTSPFRVYRWDSETDTATEVVTYTGNGRFGDKFTVTGKVSDNSVRIWAANSVGEVVMFTTSDNGYTFNAFVDTLNNSATGGSPVVYPNADGSEYYYTASGQPVMRYNYGGTVIDTLSTGLVSSSTTALRYLTFAGKEFLAIYNFGTSNENLRIVDVTYGLESATLDTLTPSLGAVSNGNGTGDVAFKDNKDGSFDLYVMGTNNGLAGYEYRGVTVTTVSDIASLRAQIGTSDILYLESEAILTYWQTFRSKKWIQDATAGIEIDDNNGVIQTLYNIGDGITGIYGTLNEYNDMMQFVPVEDPGPATSTGNSVAPAVLTADDFNNNHEQHEAELVQIDSVYFAAADGSTVFNTGTNYDVYTAAGDTIVFRTEFFAADYIGTVIPSGFHNLIGIAREYRGTAQLTSRNQTDIIWIPPAASMMYTVWEKTAAQGTIPDYFTAVGSNYERGMTYANFDGEHRLFVASRSGGPKVIMHDALTGDTLSTLEYISGPGLFPVNAMASSDDGVVLASNMTTDASAGSEFTVYLWVNETTPGAQIISYENPGKRMGDMFSAYGSLSDNSLTIWAGMSGVDSVVKFTTTDGSIWTPEVIALQGATVGTLPNVAEADDGSFYFKSYTKPLVHYASDGSVIDTIPTSVVGSAVTKIKYFKDSQSGAEVLLLYEPDEDATGDAELVRILDLSQGDDMAYTIAYTPTLGAVANGNGTGSVDVLEYDTDTRFVYVLGTNNGIACYASDTSYAIVGVNDFANDIPKEYALEQNYPNPFNPATTIQFSLRTEANVTLTIYNILGEKVSTLISDQVMQAGIQKMHFDASRFASGVYFYRLQVNGTDGSEFTKVKKMMLLK